MLEGNSHCSVVEKPMERRKCCFRLIGQEMTLKRSDLWAYNGRRGSQAC